MGRARKGREQSHNEVWGVHVKKGVDVASRTHIPNDALKCRLDNVADGFAIIVHQRKFCMRVVQANVLCVCRRGKGKYHNNARKSPAIFHLFLF